ncbi:hypothetical protein GCM10011579_008580 [Streptomyces albiflavescens]|uniref:Uncharacterized protein n=1 Tax=Streptomyces albiflavescens TaxID=1623582 RepID=A0A917XTS3_9ACTN|nr:hypothetical protein GCM10011579_008580 [Streptomyces albiflavescens]
MNATGVAPERVGERLAGAPPGGGRSRFCERLTFLRDTRLDARGRKLSLRKIASEVSASYGVSLSYNNVHYLLNGRSEPGREVAAALERFFGVPVGWCSLSESEALAAHVAPLLQQLKTVKAYRRLPAPGRWRRTAELPVCVDGPRSGDSVAGAVGFTGCEGLAVPLRQSQLVFQPVVGPAERGQPRDRTGHSNGKHASLLLN